MDKNEIEKQLFENVCIQADALLQDNTYLNRIHDENNNITIGGGGEEEENKQTSESMFYKFIENSTISLVTNESYFGVVFKAVLNENNNIDDINNYYFIKTYNDENNVKNVKKSKLTSICLKFTLVEEPVETNTIQIKRENKPDFMINDKPKKYSKKNDSYKEAFYQNMLYANTNYTLDPICPAIVFFRIFENVTHSENFINIMINRCENIGKTISIFDNLKTSMNGKPNIKLCITAMEFIENAVTIEKYLEPNIKVITPVHI